MRLCPESAIDARLKFGLGLLAALLPAALLPAPWAHAQDTAGEAGGWFARAEASYAHAELDTALTQYEAAWHEGIEDRSQLARTHLRMGTLHAMLGRPEPARRHFLLAVTLDPSLQAPSELPPPLQPLFADAVAARVPFDVSVETLEVGPPVRVRVSVTDALVDAAAALSIRVEGAPARRTATDEPFEFTVPPEQFGESPTLSVEARALDAHGGVLAEGHATLERPRPTPAPVASPTDAAASTAATGRAPSTPPAESPSGGLVDSPWFWLTGALVVLAAAGLTIGLAVGLGQDVYEFGVPTVSR